MYNGELSDLVLLFPALADLRPQTRVVLDGGLYYGGVRRTGEFTM